VNDIDKLPLQVNLDWQAYFAEFKRAHGENPVYFGKDQLLFADGWRYSSESYAGPEWPPPKNKHLLRRLKIAYWERRRNIVVAELRFIKNRLDYFYTMQNDRDLPLQQRFIRYDPDLDKRVIERGPIDFELMEARIKALEEDIINCNGALSLLDRTVKEDNLFHPSDCECEMCKHGAKKDDRNE